jgi:hypothetical protein
MVACVGADGEAKFVARRYSGFDAPARSPLVTENERRREHPLLPAVLKSELNPEQKETLGELEKFGWELRFVRHDPEQRPVPVIFDAEREKFAVLDADGNLDENAFINIR